MSSKTKTFKVGEIVGGVVLKNAYDDYIFRVLNDGYFEEVEREKKQRRKYKIKKELPILIEYQKLKRQKYATTVKDLINDATLEIECLKDEMQNWYDNLPENFQNGSKGEEIQEAINGLENYSEPDVPAVAEEIATVYFPPLDCSSRQARLSDCANMLQEAKEAIQSHIDEQNTKAEEAGGEFDASELEDCANELETLADSLEGDVSFPGMF